MHARCVEAEVADGGLLSHMCSEGQVCNKGPCQYKLGPIQCLQMLWLGNHDCHISIQLRRCIQGPSCVAEYPVHELLFRLVLVRAESCDRSSVVHRRHHRVLCHGRITEASRVLASALAKASKSWCLAIGPEQKSDAIERSLILAPERKQLGMLDDKCRSSIGIGAIGIV